MKLLFTTYPCIYLLLCAWPCAAERKSHDPTALEPPQLTGETQGHTRCTTHTVHLPSVHC